LEPNKEQIDAVLESTEDVIVFDFSEFTTQGAININFDAEWFKDVDKTITIITAEGSITIKTKMLWNNSGKTRVITVQDNKVDIKNK
jgi:phosphohistidine swiveling domain-containing protein